MDHDEAAGMKIGEERHVSEKILTEVMKNQRSWMQLEMSFINLQ